MFSPLTRTLVKIFAYGFYRVHSGLLLFLFVTVIIYFFFINVLNQTHLTPDEILLYNFSLVLAFVRHPTVLAFIFSFWFIYALKSAQYVAGQLVAPEQQFLFYSSTSLSKASQFRSWFLAQLVMALPLISYGLFAFVLGFIYHYYVYPIIILLYIIALTAMNAFVYVQLVNRLLEADSPSYLLTITRSWRKPYFSLFLYYLVDNHKLSFVLTKVFSGLIITGLLHFFSDVNPDFRLAGIIMLTVVIAHAILIYQEHRFKETFMHFARNLPYSRHRLFLNSLAMYLLLLLPESIWLLIKFNSVIAAFLFVFGLSTALLFHSLLYWLGLNMTKYLRVVFGLFILLQLLLLFGLLWFLVLFNLMAAYLLFYKFYYQYQSTA